MKRLFTRIKPTDPLITSRWLDIAFSATWFILFGYAIATFVTTLNTFLLAGAPDWYSSVWSAGVGISSLVAALGSAWIFFEGKVALITKKRLEFQALLVLGAFNMLYLILLIIVTAHNQPQLLSQIFRVADFMPLLIFRLYHLNSRIKGMVSLALKKDPQP